MTRKAGSLRRGRSRTPRPGRRACWLEFEWDGARLMAVRGYQGADHRAPRVYERTMQYQDDRLVSEEIKSQSKTSKIKYNYNAGQTV